MVNRLFNAGLAGLFFLLTIHATMAQDGDTAIKPVVIDPLTLGITYNKTTNLIFPYAIKSVDRGSGAVIVQKAKGLENILQVKASKKDFEQTNLSLVTADGKFYSFLLFYAPIPLHLNISFSDSEPMQLAGQEANAHQLEKESWQVLGANRFMGLHRKAQELCLRLNGIFLSENNMWFRLALKNYSQVNFRPEYLRFFLRDKKRSKRTALQETEVFPVYIPAYSVTKGEMSSVLAVGFKPFTVPKHQQLIIQVGDESGGRVLHLPVKSRFFLRARKLPS